MSGKDKNVSEKVVKSKVRNILRTKGVWYCTPIGAGFGAIAHDFLCCVSVKREDGVTYGQFVSIETKSSKGVLRPRQIAAATNIVESSGIVLLVNPDNVAGLAHVIDQIATGSYPASA